MIGEDNPDEFIAGGRPDETALFESLLRSRGVPVTSVSSSAFRGNWVRVPGSHAHLARQFLRDYERKERIREITPEEYARRQKRLLLLVAVSLAIAVGLLFFIGRRSIW